MKPVSGDPYRDHLRNQDYSRILLLGLKPEVFHLLTHSDTLPGNHESHCRRYVCPWTVFRAADKLSTLRWFQLLAPSSAIEPTSAQPDVCPHWDQCQHMSFSPAHISTNNGLRSFTLAQRLKIQWDYCYVLKLRCKAIKWHHCSPSGAAWTKTAVSSKGPGHQVIGSSGHQSWLGLGIIAGIHWFTSFVGMFFSLKPLLMTCLVSVTQLANPNTYVKK